MTLRLMTSFTISLIILLTLSVCCKADLLLNGSFEFVPGSNAGQSLMPEDWVQTQVTADTYSNDGSYGLAPSDFNNFTGVTAQDGIRFIAGADGGASGTGIEAFGQNLAVSLIEGETFQLGELLWRICGFSM